MAVIGRSNDRDNARDEQHHRPCVRKDVDVERYFQVAVGERPSAASGNADVERWLPTEKDKAFVKSLMKPVHQADKYASWIAPPAKGLDDKGIDYEYVKMA